MAATPARDTQSSKALHTPNALPENAVAAITTALNAVLADTFALYLKTKNFHWHVSGPHFRDYHLLFDEQAAQVLATTDLIAERVRKIGGATLRSIGHIGKLQRVKDNDESFVAPGEMLRELMADNKALAEALRQAHASLQRGAAQTAGVWQAGANRCRRMGRRRRAHPRGGMHRFAGRDRCWQRGHARCSRGRFRCRQSLPRNSRDHRSTMSF